MDHVSCNDKKIRFDLEQNIQADIYYLHIFFCLLSQHLRLIILVLNFHVTRSLASLTPVLFISLSNTSNHLFSVFLFLSPPPLKTCPNHILIYSLSFCLLSKPFLYYFLHINFLFCLF